MARATAAHPRKLSHTRESLQAEADSYCEALRAGKYPHVPKRGFRVYTDTALHDLAIGAPPGFSASYDAVAARSRSSRLTVYVKTDVSEWVTDSLSLMTGLILRHATAPLVLDGHPRRAFVSRRNLAFEAMMRKAAFEGELDRANDDHWQTDPAPRKLGDLLRDRQAYPQDYIPDDV